MSLSSVEVEKSKSVRAGERERERGRVSLDNKVKLTVGEKKNKGVGIEQFQKPCLVQIQSLKFSTNFLERRTSLCVPFHRLPSIFQLR